MSAAHIASWDEPERCKCGTCEEWCGRGHVRFRLNGVEIGSVFFADLESGPFYPLTQIKRFGAFRTLEEAKCIVEDNAAYDAYTYPTRGNA